MERKEKIYWLVFFAVALIGFSVVRYNIYLLEKDFVATGQSILKKVLVVHVVNFVKSS
jgi:hypothetical protein